MVNKMVDASSAILLLICSHEVWVKEAYDWSMALYLCVCLCWLCFHWSKLRHKHKHKQKKNELFGFFFVLMLMLMSTQFSLAYTCACACDYVYAYARVKTRLKISNFRVNTASLWVIKQLRISFGSISPVLYLKLAGEHIHSSQGNTLSLLWCAAKWSFALYDC